MARVQKQTLAFRGNVRAAIRMAVASLDRITAYNAGLSPGSGLPLVWPNAQDEMILGIRNSLDATLAQLYPPAANPA